MSNQRLTKALQKFVKRIRDERLRGTLGRTNADGTVTVEAPRQNYVFVTMPDGTVTQLPNTGKGHVPLRANLPVLLIRLHNGDLALDGYDNSLLEGDTYLPGPHGVLPHASSHQHGGTDEVGTATPSANAIIKADADGYIGAGWLDPADLASGSVTSVNGQTGTVVLDPDDLDDTSTTNKFTTAAEISKLAGIETAADVTDAGNIASSIAGVSTDDTIVDADVWGYLTGGALVKTAWSNIKAVLKTYFDTLYAATAKGVTNGDSHDHNGGDGASIPNAGLTNSAVTIGSTAVSLGATAATVAGLTLTTPTIASLTNAQHDHSNAAGGGNLGTSALSNDAVTFAKMQNIATDSLIGRDTALSGDPENILLNATLSMDGSGNLQRAALTGDVTASAGSNTTAIGTDKVLTAMIADAQVTLAKMANLAQATIIGRASGAGTGVPTALTAAQVVAIIQASIDHGSIAGLGDDDHAQYALLAGRSGGQTLKGGTASGDDLTLLTTNNATKGNIFFGAAGGTYDEANDRWGFGIVDPTVSFEVSRPDGESAAMRFISYGTALNTGIGIYTPRGTRASPSANLSGDTLGLISFGGYDTGISNGAQIRAVAAADWGSAGDSTDNPTDLIFLTVPDGSGTLTEALRLTSAQGATLTGPVTINDAGADVDVRMEGDTDANLFFLDASTDRVGIGTATPATKLEVNGEAKVEAFTSTGLHKQTGNVKYVSTQFDKTNSTLADITGLSVALPASGSYIWRAKLPLLIGPSTAGAKVATAYSGTSSAFRAVGQMTSAAATSIQFATAVGLLHTYNGVASVNVFVEIEGYIVSTGAGNLTLQFAQNVTNATASSVLTGAYLEVIQVA